MNAHTLAHWKWQLGKQGSPKAVRRPRRERSAAAVSFTEVAMEPVSAPATSAIEIVVDAGLVIRVGAQFDEDTLRRVLERANSVGVSDALHTRACPLDVAAQPLLSASGAPLGGFLVLKCSRISPTPAG